MNQPLLLYDGYCALCDKTVKFIIKHDSAKQFYFTTLTGNTAKKLNINQKVDSVVLYYNNQLYYQADAAFMVIKILNRPLKWLLAFKILPKFITNTVYNMVAKTRYNIFGKFKECPLPPLDWRKNFLP